MMFRHRRENTNMSAPRIEQLFRYSCCVSQSEAAVWSSPTYFVFLACSGGPEGTVSKQRRNVKDVLSNWQRDGKRCRPTRETSPLVWNEGDGVEWKWTDLHAWRVFVVRKVVNGTRSNEKKLWTFVIKSTFGLVSGTLRSSRHWTCSYRHN